MKLSVKILTMLVVGMLLTLPTFAQTGEGIVSGKVIGRDGMPAQGIVIYIDRMNSLNANQKVVAQRFETKTGKNGSYSYNGLPPGSYVVTLIENKVPLMVKGEAIGDTITVANGREGTANFDMTKAPAAAEAAAGTPGGPAPSAEALAADRKALEEAAKNKGIRDKAFKAGTEAYNAGLAAEATAKDDAGKAVVKGHFEEAVKQFQVVVGADPKQDVAFNNLGSALHSLRRDEEAAAAYQKAIQLKPMVASYYNNLGLALSGSKKFDEAQAAFETAATMDPAKAGDYMFNAGAMYNNNNNYPKAIEAFQKTLKVDPNNKKAMLQIALSYMGTEATMPQAVPILQKFLTLNPSPQDAELAKAYLEAIQTVAPTEYKSEKALADEKAKAEKEAKAAAAKAKTTTTTPKKTN